MSHELSGPRMMERMGATHPTRNAGSLGAAERAISVEDGQRGALVYSDTKAPRHQTTSSLTAAKGYVTVDHTSRSEGQKAHPNQCPMKGRKRGPTVGP
ncbi:MAG: hypothetical protein V7775_10385 [Sulfitobacter sp.]